MIVLGCGGMGSAALYYLANLGINVLGIDRFNPPHHLGSTHGENRLIRQAYFEHPDYVPLCFEAYDLWDELMLTTGTPLMLETGLLQIGAEDSDVVGGALQSAKAHALDIEHVSAEDARQRFPDYRIADGMSGLFEKRAGILWVEECVRAFIRLAKSQGAELLTNTEVSGWEKYQDIIRVKTNDSCFTCSRLIISAGSWTNDLLADLGIQLQVKRKPMFWFELERGFDRRLEYPASFLYGIPEGIFYGLVDKERKRLKICEHTAGDEVSSALVDRSLHVRDSQVLENFIRTYLKNVRPHHNQHAVCMYTMTKDTHFIVDQYPGMENVVFAAGMSGHGFKFAPVIGKALADLALYGSSELPINFLNCNRPSLYE